MVVTLTLENVQRKNALTTEMFEQLLVAFEDVAGDDDARCLVICGAGDDFSSGADLSESAADRGHWLPYMRWASKVCTALHELPKPTIAKVKGVAVGAGANLAFGCDLVIATPDARFSEIFIKRALCPDMGGTYLLPRLVGIRKAKELAYFGTMISGSDAVEAGLANRTVSSSEIDTFVDQWAEQLAASPPLALSLTNQWHSL